VAERFGVGPVSGEVNEAERRQRRHQLEQRQAQRQRAAEEQRVQEMESAIARADETWAGLAHRHEAGESYLAGRGLGALAGRADTVRFNAIGAPCVALYSFDGGHVVNVVTRQLPPREPKVIGMKGAPTAGTLGQASAFDLDITSGHVVLVEGVADWLTAVVLFERFGHLVVGAHGAGNLPKIAKAIAPELAQRGRRFLFVPHEDMAGERAMEGSIDAAIAAGVAFDPELDMLNLGGAAKDLNDALRMEAGDVRDLI